MASAIGMKTMSRIAAVITATAKPLRPENRASSLSRIGHVATTIIVAQTIEVMKGRSIQMLAVIRMPMNTTASVVRVTSWLIRFCVLIIVSLRKSYVPSLLFRFTAKE